MQEFFENCKCVQPMLRRLEPEWLEPVGRAMGARKTSATKGCEGSGSLLYKSLLQAQRDHEGQKKAGRKKQSEDKKVQAHMRKCLKDNFGVLSEEETRKVNI